MLRKSEKEMSFRKSPDQRTLFRSPKDRKERVRDRRFEDEWIGKTSLPMLRDQHPPDQSGGHAGGADRLLWVELLGAFASHLGVIGGHPAASGRRGDAAEAIKRIAVLRHQLLVDEHLALDQSCGPSITLLVSIEGGLLPPAPDPAHSLLQPLRLGARGEFCRRERSRSTGIRKFLSGFFL